MLHFSQTLLYTNLKLGTVVACDEGFPKMYILITFHEGHRSSGVITCENCDFCEKMQFFSQYCECMNETERAYRRLIGLVYCIMFAHLTEVKSRQDP